ncbi:MAG: HlyD family efflux transporter periplasmic adaptor subunit [Methylococcales bacterium]
MPTNYKYILPWAILATGVLVFTFLWLTKPTQAPLKKNERVWQVEVMIAHPARLSPTLTIYGQVETPDLQKAAAPRKSRVREVMVREGEHVSPQQLLLTLDPRDFEPRIQQAKAKTAKFKAEISSENLRYESDRNALKNEKTLLDISEAAVKRANQMKIRSLGSIAALDQVKQAHESQLLSLASRKLAIESHTARLQQLKAQLDTAKATLDLATLDFERSQIHADFSGFIASVDVSKGDPVNTNQQLLTLYPSDNLEVRAKIPVPYQAEIQHSIQQNIPLKAKATIAGSTIHLILDRLSGQADGRGIDAFFRPIGRTDIIRLGSTLSLQMERPPRDHAVAIPHQALYSNDRVFKLINGRLQSVKITTLGEYVDKFGDANLLISDPTIMGGDQIVTTHLPNAITGLRVSVRVPEKQ